MSIDLENSVPITVENRTVWEKTQNLGTLTKIRNSAADTFTPYQIKFLSNNGRNSMGYYGIIALTLLLTCTTLNAYGLRNESPIVIFNSLLASTVSLFTLEKTVSGYLNSFLKRFQ